MIAVVLVALLIGSGIGLMLNGDERAYWGGLACAGLGVVGLWWLV